MTPKNTTNRIIPSKSTTDWYRKEMKQLWGKEHGNLNTERISGT